MVLQKVPNVYEKADVRIPLRTQVAGYAFVRFIKLTLSVILVTGAPLLSHITSVRLLAIPTFNAIASSIPCALCVPYAHGRALTCELCVAIFGRKKHKPGPNSHT